MSSSVVAKVVVEVPLPSIQARTSSRTYSSSYCTVLYCTVLYDGTDGGVSCSETIHFGTCTRCRRNVRTVVAEYLHTLLLEENMDAIPGTGFYYCVAIWFII